MFKKLIGRFYNGNPNKADFTEKDLPKNRIMLFFHVLGTRLFKLVQLNMIYFVAIIPTLIWTVWTFMAVMEAAAPAEGVVPPDIGLVLRDYFLILIPCMALAGPGTAGATYVLRRWAQDEHAFVWGDFWAALKANFTQSMVLNLLNGLAFFVLYFCYWYYGTMAIDNIYMRLPQYFIMFLAIFVVMMNQYMMPLLVTYDLSIRKIITNAARLTILRLPQSVGILLCTLIPFCTIFLGTLFLSLFYSFFGFMLTGLLWVSEAVAAFDKFINPNIEGVEINRGLHPDYKG